MLNQVTLDGIIYSLEENNKGEKIARIVGHTPELVGTLEEHHPSSYRIIEGPVHVEFEHNGSKYGPIELPHQISTLYIVKEGLLDINIPEVVGNGHKVVSIEDSALMGCSRIRKISLPQSMMLIDKYAFSGCRNLVNLELHGKVNISSIKSPFPNTALHYLTVHNSDALMSAEVILNDLKFERGHDHSVNTQYPHTGISTIIIAKDANISEEDIQDVEKEYKVYRSCFRLKKMYMSQ